MATRQRRASTVTLSSTLNQTITVDESLKIRFPFSPYIDNYFRRIRREIEKLAERQMADRHRSEHQTKDKTSLTLSESQIEGQLLVISILENTLKQQELDVILGINRSIRLYVYDISMMLLNRRFASFLKTLTNDSSYFGKELTIFLKRFILCATAQAHIEHKPMGLISGTTGHKVETSMTKDVPISQQRSESNLEDSFIGIDDSDSDMSVNYGVARDSEDEDSDELSEDEEDSDSPYEDSDEEEESEDDSDEQKDDGMWFMDLL